MQLANQHDQRTNIIRISRPALAAAAVMSERQVVRILQQLELPRMGYPKGILKRVSGGAGKGNISLYSFVGFSVAKGDIPDTQKVTLETPKGDIPAAKGDIGDSAIRNIRTSKELQEENQNNTPNGALKIWFEIKQILQDEFPEADWIRSMYLYREYGDTLAL